MRQKLYILSLLVRIGMRDRGGIVKCLQKQRVVVRLLISHRVPLKPDGHWHLYELKHGTHVAWFRHGLLRHTSEKEIGVTMDKFQKLNP